MRFILLPRLARQRAKLAAQEAPDTETPKARNGVATFAAALRRKNKAAGKERPAAKCR